jgi:cytochrome P450
LRPVFKVRALDRQFTVIAGPEANAFITKDGDALLGSDELFGDMGREMNNTVNLVAMDGERHRAWRKIMRPGYSREAFVSHLPRVIELIRTTAQDWGVGQPVPVVSMFRRLITGDSGLDAGESGEYFDDIWHYFNCMLQVLVMRPRPGALPGPNASAFEFAPKR